MVAHGAGIATHQVGISVADGESASISIAAPALERFRPGLADELRASPYLTQFPASLDPSPFPGPGASTAMVGSLPVAGPPEAATDRACMSPSARCSAT